MKVQKVPGIALLVVIATPAWATSDAWYVGGSAHQFNIDAADTTYRRPPQDGDPAQNFEFDSDVDNGTGMALVGGWDAPSYTIRLEFEYLQYSSDINEFGTQETGQLFTGKAEAQQLVFMAFHDIRWIGFLPERLHPYLGLGFGVGIVEFDDESDNGIIGVFSGGLSYDITKSFTLDLGYRHFDIDSLDYGNSTNDRPLISTSYKGDAVTLGVRWYWSRRFVE